MQRKAQIVMLIATFVVVGLASFFASSHPDGLEWVAENLGFIQKITGPKIAAPLPDYTISFIKSPSWSASISGIIGVIIVFLATILLGRIVKKKD